MNMFDTIEFNHKCKWLSHRAFEFAKKNNISKKQVPFNIQFIELEIIPILNEFFKQGSKEWSTQLSKIQSQISCELSFF